MPRQPSSRRSQRQPQTRTTPSRDPDAAPHIEAMVKRPNPAPFLVLAALLVTLVGVIPLVLALTVWHIHP